MPRRFLRRYIPDHATIRDHKHLRFLGALIHDPNLLHLNRRSVSGAFAVGLFVAFIPMPFQMVLAAIIAIITRVNLPIAASLVWLTNPVTMPPVFYFSYKLGTWILDTPAREFVFEASWGWLTSEMSTIWQPFLLGCFILGATSAITGYILVRLIWRLHVAQNWRKRSKVRKNP